MGVSFISDLPLFDHAITAGADDVDVARIEAHAKAHPWRGGFAYYQDEPEMSRSFSLSDAVAHVYGKTVDRDTLPEGVQQLLQAASEAGLRAMTAAECREDTDAQLAKRIAGYEATLAAPARRKKRGSGGDDDQNMDRVIVTEWLSVARVESERRAAIAGFSHTSDLEQRAREKFGPSGLAHIQRHVAADVAEMGGEALANVTVNGRRLWWREFFVRTDRERLGFCTAAAHRFVGALASARRAESLGIPDGYVVSRSTR